MDEAASALRILQLLRDGPQTAQQLAAQLDLDVSSVRRHLDAMLDRGLLEKDDRIQGPGRPKRHYSLTDAGWETFPRDYAFLLQGLLGRLEERVGRDAIREAFADLAAKLAGPINPTHTKEARLNELGSLYNELGFQASIEPTSEGAFLVQRNCPFLKMAKADPEGLCDCLDENIMRNALPEAEIQLRDCMATGDSLCRHLIRME